MSLPDTKAMNDTLAADPLVLAKAAMARRDFAAAETAWAACRAVVPADPRAWTEGAAALLALGRQPAALALLAEGMARFPAEAALLVAGLALAGTAADSDLEAQAMALVLAEARRDRRACVDLAAALAAQGLVDAAEDCLRAGIVEHTTSALCAVTYARMAQDRKDKVEAERRWADAYSRFRQDSKVGMGWAEALLALGRHVEAEACLGGLLLADPDNARARQLAAGVAGSLGNWALAERRWAAEATRQPDNAKAWLGWATAVERDGKLEKAEAVLAVAMTRCPDEPKLCALGLDIAERRRDWPQAQRHAETLTRLAPQREVWWLRLGHALRWQGEQAAADAAFAEALDLLPAPTQAQLGWSGKAATTPAAVNGMIRLEVITRGPRNWPERPGWENVAEAVIFPQRRYQMDDPVAALLRNRGPILDGGAYAADGSFVRRALHYNGLWRFVPEAGVNLGAATTRLAGRWLFGGLARHHVGHFLVESTARLWLLGQGLPPVDGVVFFSEANSTDHSAAGASDETVRRFAEAKLKLWYIKAMLDIFAPGLPVHIVAEPVVVEQLVVPDQLMAYAPRADHLMAGHPVYQQFVRDQVSRVLAPLPDEPTGRIYVSRGKMPISKGFFFREDLLEANLVQEGYRVIYPELLSMAEQLRLYRHASHVVLGTGTAAHVVALAMSGSQQVMLLARGKESDPVFLAQMHGMGAEAREVNAVDGVFRPAEGPGRKPRVNAHRTVTALRLAEVWAALREAGFVAGPMSDDGEATHAAALRDTLDKLQASYGWPFELQPA